MRYAPVKARISVQCRVEGTCTSFRILQPVWAKQKSGMGPMACLAGGLWAVQNAQHATHGLARRI
ncbi:hypothetical protein AC579_8483 [Pseudocercospora musae]|uniref:Uncharacterized protein n=1 Tax=Pseudocercospora musae TaxID=113226 RepID=A0A139I0J8_9PEZI|nr:hypothetical protein AC579_8483 [Pseudocercospora musae]